MSWRSLTATASPRLSDGREVVTRFRGTEAAVRLLEGNRATPVSLARGDFDGDGIDDLVIGYAGEGAGIVSLLRGNPDAIYPNSPEARARKAAGTFTETPFLSPALVASVPRAPDFLGTGDFDGDDRLDIVTASRDGDSLHLLSGDGVGGLNQGVEIELPGNVTALAAGEINRADGLTDLAVGVVRESGPAMLVYEGPLGALRSQPETFPLPGPTSDLAIGQLDDDPALDLAVAAGNRLTLIHGRDRRLSLNERERAKVGPAKIESREFDFSINSLCLGEFRRAGRAEVALLDDDGVVRRLSRSGIGQWELGDVAGSSGFARGLARARLTAGDDLLLIDPVAREVRVMGLDSDGETVRTAALQSGGEPVATLPMRLNAHARDSLVVISRHRVNPSVMLQEAGQTYIVNKTDDHDDGECTPDDCTLREAIVAANANPGPDQISFNLRIERSVAGVVIGQRSESAAPPRAPSPIVITHESELPEIVDSVVIDGTTQPRFAGSPLIRLRGTRLFISNKGGTTLRGLSVHFIEIRRNVDTVDPIQGNIIEGNWVGDDASDPSVSGSDPGIFLRFCTDTIIGGPSAHARNVISGNRGNGVDVDNATGVLIQGNYIGVDPSGNVALPNRGEGINQDEAPVALRILDNVISGNERGILLDRERNGLIQGNIIGGNADGSAAIPNLRDGIQLRNVQITIGGTTRRARNVISGNGGNGLGLGLSGVLIQGNLIGTDASGSRSLGNSEHGIYAFAQSGLNIGGEIASAGNVISGNGKYGIELELAEAIIQNNLIGVDASGTRALPNLAGINANFDIGGSGRLLKNVISGNSTFAVRLGYGRNLTILGNLIGVDRAGTTEIPNGEGISVIFCPGITIGGEAASDRNIISGNLGDGIAILDTPSAVVQGNFIGTDGTGTRAIPNRGNGLLFSLLNYNSPPLALIGGDTDAARNVISGNGEHGIAIGPPRKYLDREGSLKSVNGGEGVTVERNLIGTDVTGEKPLGNGIHGIFLDNRTFIHTIKRNRIAYNQGSGVFVPNQGSGLGNPGVQIRITENEIFENGAIGIDLGEAGPTPNHDPLPTPEANDGQNYPEFSRIVSNNQSTTVAGSLKSKPNTTFVLEFFSNQGAGGACRPEGRNFNASATVTTDANGQATFNITFPKSTLGGFINATATNSTGNRPGSTSEFSTCQAVAAPPGPRIQEITVLPDSITAIGAGLTSTVQVLVDEVAFETPAIVEAGRKVLQRGKLVNGQSIAEAIPPRKTVRITFRNSDGGVFTATFRN